MTLQLHSKARNHCNKSKEPSCSRAQKNSWKSLTMGLARKENKEVTSRERGSIEWDFGVPDRTLFFSLRAKGLGTAFVEGLTGYMRRLARAHRVTVADLVCHG